MKDSLEEFSALVAEALKVFDQTYDCRESGPYFLKVLEYIKRNPRLETLLKAYLVELIENSRKDFIPLVAFCMHELQWEEIRNATCKKIADHIEKRRIPPASPLSHTYYHAILDAYDADWEDCVFYEYYKSEWT